jgi:hypothetical protein
MSRKDAAIDWRMLHSNTMETNAHLLIVAVVFDGLQSSTGQGEESGNNAKWNKGFDGNRLYQI